MKVRKVKKSKLLIVAVIIIVIILLALITALTPRTYAATTEDGLFNYTLEYNNTITITKCNDIGVVDIIIPSTIDG